MSEETRNADSGSRRVYTYADHDTLRDNPDVDIIYIVLPNSMHAEYTVRGARAGKHILCEKPMATSSVECRQIIEACRTAGKKLMIAYRIQSEPNDRLRLPKITTRDTFRGRSRARSVSRCPTNSGGHQSFSDSVLGKKYECEVIPHAA